MSDTNATMEMTAAIVSAFVGNNALRATELPELISTVYASLSGVASPKPVGEPVAELKPAVPVKKSVTDDYIVCLEDGKKFKSLRRHLQTAFGMTPDDYRAKWGLPRDYPMVAPGYAAKRSELAKATGLGSSRRNAAPAAEPAPAALPPSDEPSEAEQEPVRKTAAKRAKAPDEVASEPAEDPAPKRRGRPKKAA